MLGGCGVSRDRTRGLAILAGTLTRVTSLAAAVAIAGATGVGRWHPAQPAMMLAWPQALALGSHWVELAPAA